MSDHTNNQPFQTSSKSRKRTPRQKNWLLIPLVLLLLLMAVSLFFILRHVIRSFGNSTDASTAATVPVQTTTQAPPKTTTAAVPETSAQATLPPAPTAAPETSAAPTDAPTTTPAETVPPVTQPPATTAAPPVSDTFHLYTAAEVLPLPEDIARGYFTDINASDANGSWWFGRKVRDLNTGAVTTEYERYKVTLDLLAKYGAIYRKNEDQKVCYLTFDCGYEYGFTSSILDTLKEKNVKAIFFIAGDFVNDAKNTELLKRMYNEGHLIGSHTDHHLNMPRLSDEEFIDELNNLQLKVNKMLGFDYQIHYYRPPEGASGERDIALAKRMNITTVFWSYAYADYNTHNQPDVASSLEKAKTGLHDGCVYLLHAVSSTNAAMLGDLIDFMKDQGYDIRRLDQ